ncbi:MAG: thioredoxin family protein [Candidatus Hermodarchaeota archaeon]
MKSEEENYCAKCCKTMNIIERMFSSIPEFKEKIEVSYEDVYLNESVKKYGALTPPAIIINGQTLTEGHVPIMKKLARDLLDIINPTKLNM